MKDNQRKAMFAKLKGGVITPAMIRLEKRQAALAAKEKYDLKRIQDQAAADYEAEKKALRLKDEQIRKEIAERKKLYEVKEYEVSDEAIRKREEEAAQLKKEKRAKFFEGVKERAAMRLKQFRKLTR